MLYATVSIISCLLSLISTGSINQLPLPALISFILQH